MVLVTGESKDESKLKSLSEKDGFYGKEFEEIFWEWTEMPVLFLTP